MRWGSVGRALRRTALLALLGVASVAACRSRVAPGLNAPVGRDSARVELPVTVGEDTVRRPAVPAERDPVTVESAAPEPPRAARRDDEHPPRETAARGPASIRSVDEERSENDREVGGFAAAALTVAGLDSLQAMVASPVTVEILRPFAGEPLPSRVTDGRFRVETVVGDSVNACLHVDSAFSISAPYGACYTQAIVSGRPTRWLWTVTPHDSGNKLVRVNVRAILASGTSYALFDTAYVIRVRVGPAARLAPRDTIAKRPLLERATVALKDWGAVIAAAVTLVGGLATFRRELKGLLTGSAGAGRHAPSDD